jgi:microcystin-dependent protein
MRRFIRAALAAMLLIIGAADRAGAALTGVTGGGQPHSNVQPSLGINYLMRFQGPADELGQIRMFAGDYAPGGWVIPQGQLASINQSSALYSKLGTTYGGDGQNTFALPDLRDRLAVEQGAGVALTNRTLGAAFGANSSSMTLAQMPAHNHDLPNGGGKTGMAGGNAPMRIMQSSLALNAGVVMFGDYPSQQSMPAEPFLGQVRMSAATSLPNHAVPANGQLAPISQNAALFSILGTSYGGNGQTTFALPDLRGRAAIHAGAGPALSPRSLGQSIGDESVSLGVANLPSHHHTVGADITGDTGSGAAYANMQPSLGLHYIIATQGVWPDHNSDIGDDTFLGEISLFAGNTAPKGWALCDGQIMSIAQHTALFAILGDNYGGNGQTTFGLPDLRGRVAVEPGTLFDLGEVTGSESIALTVDQLPRHAHEVPEPTSLAAIGLLIAILSPRRRR